MAAALAYQWGMSPNAVSVVSSLFSLAGIALLASAPPSAKVAVGVTALMALGYVLDSADGQLARLSGRGSAAGEWLDHVLDAGRIPLFHIAVGICFATHPESDSVWPQAVALAFAMVASVRFFALILAEKLSPPKRKVEHEAPVWHSFAKLPLDVGFVYLSILTLPWFPVFIGIYTALFVATLLMTLVSLRGKYINLASG